MTATIDTLYESVSPEGIAVYLRPAGPYIRFLAWLIDTGFEMVIILVGYTLLSIAAGFTGAWLLFLFMFVVTWFYRVIFEILWQGQTPGKRILGLRVVRPDGSAVDMPASFMRNLLRFADGFLGLNIIALLVMISDPAFRRLGDLAAGTLVVYTQTVDRITSHTLMATSNELESAPPLSPLSAEERQTVLNCAQRYTVLGDEQVRALCGPWVHACSGTEIEHPETWLLALADLISGKREKAL